MTFKMNELDRECFVKYNEISRHIDELEDYKFALKHKVHVNDIIDKLIDKHIEDVKSELHKLLILEAEFKKSHS